MRHDATGRMILEVKRPLLEALHHLSSHSSDIHSSWLKLLKRYEPCGKHVALLAGLHLATQAQDLRSAKPQAYREESERQGQDLAQRGVPAECAAVAVALYVESCLPYLLSDASNKAAWARAFARLASVYRFFLLSGYAQHAAVERQSMEERISRVERRSQDFSVQLGDAYERERRRLAQDLHDEIGHDLIVLKLYTEVIALDLKKGDIGQLRRKLKESVTLIKHALKGVRRLTFNLGPAIWNEQGFVPAVRLYVRQFARRTGIKVRFDAARLEANLPARYETALYKVLQGALSNVVAHSDADRVRITLASGRGSVTMKVEDDGRGFNVERKLRTPSHSFGLRAMQDRIELLGGAIQFGSRPSARRAACLGTTIELQLPLDGMEAT
jgi:signal transduction histidine kinase